MMSNGEVLYHFTCVEKEMVIDLSRNRNMDNKCHNGVRGHDDHNALFIKAKKEF